MILTTIGILFIVELGFRFYSNFTLIYDVEMHKYATKLKKRSPINGLTHEHIPFSEANLMGVDIAINNSGFREDIPTTQKTGNEKRIVFVGSSITMGWGVPYDSVFTTRIEKQLNKMNEGLSINVINTGIGNYNSVLHAILIENKIDSLQPDQVVLHYFINDAEELAAGTQNVFVKYFYSVAYYYIRIKQTLHSSKNQYKSMGEYYSDLYMENSKGWLEAQKAIVKIKNLCDSKNINFLVLIQPDLHNLADNSLQKKCHETIKGFFIKNDIKFQDLFDSFQKELEENPRTIWVNKDDPHPNSKGHDIIFNSLINDFYTENELNKL